jgi:hypothetical protein
MTGSSPAALAIVKKYIPIPCQKTRINNGFSFRGKGIGSSLQDKVLLKVDGNEKLGGLSFL